MPHPLSPEMAILKSNQSVLAMEALSVHKPLAGTVDKLSRFLDDISQTIGMSLATLKDHVAGTNSAMLSQDRHLLERLAKSQYTHLMGLQLPCIPGMTSTWLEFLQVMDKPMQLVTNINDEILVPFERYVSMAMVDPERFSNATSRAKVDIVNFDDMREGFKNTIGGNRHVATRKYQELCARNVDMAEVIRLTRAYQTAAAKTNPRLIADRVKDLRELTARLSENIKDANQSFRLSSKTIANISEAAFNIAEAVEMYATTMTLLESHIQSFDVAEKKLSRAA